jgi:hypothetical protein
MKNEIRVTMNLYTCCNHGEPKKYICTIKAGQSRLIEQIFNILAIKYGSNEVVEFLHDTQNNIIWWRKKTHKYPKFVLLPDPK